VTGLQNSSLESTNKQTTERNLCFYTEPTLYLYSCDIATIGVD
jgi:hypothetical protein